MQIVKGSGLIKYFTSSSGLIASILEGMHWKIANMRKVCMPANL